MSKVLGSHCSILIEVSKRGLLDNMFKLDFECAVPELLFHEELIDLSPYSRRDLLGLGLRVESLDAEDVEMAIAYQSERPALSLIDSFALALASHQGRNLLTEDRRIRRVALSQEISHRDALRVIDSMLNAGILSVPGSSRCPKPGVAPRGVPFPELT